LLISVKNNRQLTCHTLWVFSTLVFFLYSIRPRRLIAATELHNRASSLQRPLYYLRVNILQFLWKCYQNSSPLIRTHIHTHICTYIHMYLHTYIHTYAHTYIHMYIHTYVHTYIHTYIHTYVHTHIYTHILTYTHKHTCIYTYIHTYTHTHTHTHSQIHPNNYDWVWNSSWRELNCTIQSSQSNKLQNYIKLVRTW
jgi:hypothetical protein